MQQHEGIIYLILNWCVGEEVFEMFNRLFLLSPVIVSCWPE